MLSLVHIINILMLIINILSVMRLVGVGVFIDLCRWPSGNFFSGSGSLQDTSSNKALNKL